jgi:hypothetical protein
MVNSPNPNFNPAEPHPYSASIPKYYCMREGYINCLSFVAGVESCEESTSPKLVDNNYFCVNQVPDYINRYSLLGGGAADYVTCPDVNNFIKQIDTIGDTVTYVFPPGLMSCSKMLHVTCGAPAFRVKPFSIKPEGYRIWFLEYDISKLKSAIGNFSSLSTYDIRKYESIAAGMSRID